jgi:hypothetical protein
VMLAKAMMRAISAPIAIAARMPIRLSKRFGHFLPPLGCLGSRCSVNYDEGVSTVRITSFGVGVSFR